MLYLGSLLKIDEEKDNILWYRSENFMLSIFLHGVTIMFLNIYYRNQPSMMVFTVNNWMPHGIYLFSILLGVFIIKYRKDRDLMDYSEE